MKSRKPSWLKVKLSSSNEFAEVNSIIKQFNLHTVCSEAFCPNREQCWRSGTATFLLMGGICTRNCKFCDVTTGNPKEYLDSTEPSNLAEAIKKLNLAYAVLTEVTRDDLQDGGAEHLGKCIEEIKRINPKTKVEILIPDFCGNLKSLQRIVDAKPNVIGHNIEVVRSLSDKVRDRRANYDQSLKVLSLLKDLDPDIFTKSSFMVGLGESEEEIRKSIIDLYKVNIDILTIGQYLQPNRRCLPVKEYLRPEKFVEWKKMAEEIGIPRVVSGPLVRSSYKAAEIYDKLMKYLSLQ